MTTDFLENIENISEFSEHHLRCIHTRDARFIGKRLAHIEWPGPSGTGRYIAIFITLAGTYVAHFCLIRADLSEYSKHAGCSDVEELIEFFKSGVSEVELGKLAMIEAGIDDSVDIP